MSRENAELVRHVCERWTSGTADDVLGFYDPEVAWDASRIVAGLGELAEVANGLDGLRQFLRWWREAWEHDRIEIEELLDAGDLVISTVTQKAWGRKSGLSITRPLAAVWTIREGKIARVVWYPSREEALEAVGLRG